MGYRNPRAQWLGSPNYTRHRDGHSMAIAPAYVVIHTMAATMQSANQRFQDPGSQVSAHYGVGLDGRLVQWVDEGDAAWHAGNWGINLDSIGIEHEDGGRYDDPRPDVLYAASAALVREICQRYGIPIQHGDVQRGISGIVPHRECTATSCPDALDWQRIIALAQEGEEVDVATLDEILSLVKAIDARTGQQWNTENWGTPVGGDVPQGWMPVQIARIAQAVGVDPGVVGNKVPAPGQGEAIDLLRQILAKLTVPQVDIQALAQAIVAGLPPEVHQDPATLATAVADELAKRIAS